LIASALISDTCLAEKAELVISIVGNPEKGNFKQPSGLFFDEAKKKLYVSDTQNNRLVSFDSSYTQSGDFDAWGNLKYPTSVVKSKSGVFYVLFGKKVELASIEPAKNTFTKIELENKNIPKRENPVVIGKLAIDSQDRLYITDRGNGRILILDTTGLFIKEIMPGGVPTDFSDVKIDDDGNIYSLSTTNRKVYIFNAKGEISLQFGTYGSKDEELAFPVSLAVDKAKNIYVLEQHQGKVKVFKKSGKFQYSFSKKGSFPSQLYTPSFIYIDSMGIIYVVDRGNNRIQIFKINMH
jgi:DNA-binding beta-propeller fold protein YncE